MQIGIDSFAAAAPDENAGGGVGASESLRHLIERIEFAEQSGLGRFRGRGTPSPGLS